MDIFIRSIHIFLIFVFFFFFFVSEPDPTTLKVQNMSETIGQLHDDVILLQLPESLSVLFSCAN